MLFPRTIYGMVRLGPVVTSAWTDCRKLDDKSLENIQPPSLK